MLLSSMAPAARRAHGSSAEHAMRDLIASHAPLRGGSHKARQNGPKHYPRGFKGPQPLGTPFSSIFRRAAKDGVPEGHWKSRAVGKNVQRKISPPEVVTRRSRPVKPHNPSFAITKKHQRREQLRWCFSLRIGISPERSHIGTERKRGENRRWKHDADSCSHLTTSPAPVCE